LAISKEKKEQVVAELKELLAASKVTVISDYRGLTAAQMAELRNKLRPLDSRFLVAKNTLILRSLEELGLPQPKELLQGPTALACCFDDLSQPLQALIEFGKETELLSVKGGLLGARVLEPGQVQTLSALPGLEAVQAQALAGLQSPMSTLVGLLDSALRGLLYVFDARAEQMGEATA
jgi:large subunit ribosomal protein L10